MTFLKKIVFATVLLTTPFAQAMEIGQEDQKESPSSFHRVSKLASLYVDTWNNFDQEKSPTVLGKIFQSVHTEEDLKDVKDIKYSPSNCLPSYTVEMSYVEKAHAPFLDNFLKLQDIAKVTQVDIKRSLMFMAHDIGIARAVRTLQERGTILDQIKHTVGKLYLVMLHKEKLEREVVGTGSGTFVQNEENKKAFVLSCAHFPASMKNFDDKYSFEMYFFSHYLLDQKTFPLGTDGPKIPFDQYQDLRVNGVVFPSDVQVTLGKTPSQKQELSENDIPDIRVVIEGKKDFACFLEKPRSEMVPMSFESFTEHNKNQEFFAAGYPAWGLSDNTFAIVKGIPWTEGKTEKHQVAFTFPTLHGMSGGPLFVWDAKENKHILIGILTGVEDKILQSISYPLTGSDVAFLEDIK